MATQKFTIKGMHCASCKALIEKALLKNDAIQKAEVNYATESASITFDESQISTDQIAEIIQPLGYTLLIENNNKQTEIKNSAKAAKLAELAIMKKHVISAIPIALFAAFVMGWDILALYKVAPQMGQVAEEFFHHLLPVLATYILFVVGKDYLKGVYRFLRHGQANMDTLIGIGTGAAYLYSFVVSAFKETLEPYINVAYQYYDVTIIVITFIALGKYLEAKSKIKTGDAIEKLMNLQAKFALVIRDGAEVEIPIDQVVHGDLLIIKPGAKIPVDGVITDGSTYIDESMVTGEPMAIQKKVGDAVVAGTVNTNGVITFKATKVGAETLLAQIIKMVEEAQGSKAPIQALADKISSVFVPIVIVIAVVALAVWLFVGSKYIGFDQALSFGLMSFVGTLVIACPCALGLATPTAIIVGVGKGAKNGILIKDAETLEKLHKVSTVVVDKTGTITKGKPTLTDVTVLSDTDENTLVQIVASLEKSSEHPIATAIVDYANEHKVELQTVENFKNLEGKGIRGNINGTEYFVGNKKLIAELNLALNEADIDQFAAQGKTPVIITTKEKVLGYVMVADEIKGESVAAVKSLHKLGVKVVMLTGDDIKTAQHIAAQVGIDEVVANVLPQDKLVKIKELQQEGELVAMAGDGINDAPALAQADVGIAMGTGTDVAIESADITLLGGDISKIANAFNLSKITIRGIKQNLFWAFIYNIVGIPLAAGVFYPIFGWLLNPVFAGFAMSMSSVSVVTNSLRLKTKKI